MHAKYAYHLTDKDDQWHIESTWYVYSEKEEKYSE